MNQDVLSDIGRALNEKFYRAQDAGLLEYLRAQADRDAVSARISQVSGIEDAAVLDNLVRVGVTADSFTAFHLYPLVRVAWADQQIDDSEREAVLRAAAEEGVSVDSPNYRLLQGWLEECPSAALGEAWRDYARGLARELSESDLAEVRNRTLARARQVAEAAGGFLGLGNKISKNEELALLDLAHAFDKPADLQ